MANREESIRKIREAKVRLAQQNLLLQPSGAEALSRPDVETGEPVGAGVAALRGVGQGVTLGFSDEILAGVKAPFSEKSFEELLNEEQKKLQLAEMQNPAAYNVGQVGGGLLSLAIPGGALVRGASLAKLAGTGALVGGVSGLGHAEGDASARLEGAVKGAIVGGGTGILGAAVGKALEKSSGIMSLALGGKLGSRARGQAQEAVAKATQAELKAAKRELQNNIVNEESKLSDYLVTKKIEDKIIKDTASNAPILGRFKNVVSLPKTFGDAVEDVGAFSVGGAPAVIGNRLRKEFGGDVLRAGNKAINMSQAPIRAAGRFSLPAASSMEGSLFAPQQDAYAPENEAYLSNQFSGP